MTGAAKIAKWAGIVVVSAFVVAIVSVFPYVIVNGITDEVTGLAKYPTAIVISRTILFLSILAGVVSFFVYIVARIMREAQSKAED